MLQSATVKAYSFVCGANSNFSLRGVASNSRDFATIKPYVLEPMFLIEFGWPGIHKLLKNSKI